MVIKIVLKILSLNIAFLMHIPLLSAVQNSVFYKVRMSLRSYTFHGGGGLYRALFLGLSARYKNCRHYINGGPPICWTLYRFISISNIMIVEKFEHLYIITVRYATLIHMLVRFIYFDNENITAAARRILVWHPMNPFKLTCQICTVNSQTQLMNENCALLG
jgi:hypothetical protein